MPYMMAKEGVFSGCMV